MDLIYQIDYSILDAIQEIHCSFLDTLLGLVTHLGDGGIFWIALSVVLCLPKKTRKCGATMLFALLIGVIVCNLTLKNIFDRIRPYDNPLGSLTGEQLQALGIALPGDSSFPSGHTTASLGASVSMFIRNKKWGTPCLILGLTIAFSRMYLYLHYPTDVLVGLLVGTLAAILSAYLIDRLTASKRYGERMERLWSFSFSKGRANNG